MEDIDVAIVTAPITGVVEIQCLKWDCRRERLENSNFCSALCAVRCNVERDYQRPLLLASLYKKFADYQRFIIAKVLAGLKSNPVVQPGIPNLSEDADVLSDFPWNKPAVFDSHMENNESNKLWLFIGNFNLSPIRKVGNVVPGGMFEL